jgi:hypothetical protein
MKNDIIKILKSDDMDEDKLDSIEELVLNPERGIRREFTKSFRRCAEILSLMMNDYQFNKLDDNYMGFLNTSGNDGHDSDDFAFLVANISLFEGFIHRNGFNIQKCDFDEFILELITK